MRPDIKVVWIKICPGVSVFERVRSVRVSTRSSSYGPAASEHETPRGNCPGEKLSKWTNLVRRTARAQHIGREISGGFDEGSPRASLRLWSRARTLSSALGAIGPGASR